MAKAPEKEPDLKLERSNLFRGKSEKQLQKLGEKKRQKAAKEQDQILASFLNAKPFSNLGSDFAKAFAAGKKQALAHRTSAMPKPSMRQQINGGKPFWHLARKSRSSWINQKSGHAIVHHHDNRLADTRQLRRCRVGTASARAVS